MSGQPGGGRAAVLAVHLVELVPVAGVDVGERGHPGIEAEDLLLEAGPADNSIFIRMPAGNYRVIPTERTYKYMSEPDPKVNGRQLFVPQGRTLGGGSSVNGMVYIRGQKEDYDGWAAMGATGWSFEDVMPFFWASDDDREAVSA